MWKRLLTLGMVLTGLFLFAEVSISHAAFEILEPEGVEWFFGGPDMPLGYVKPGTTIQKNIVIKNTYPNDKFVEVYNQEGSWNVEPLGQFIEAGSTGVFVATFHENCPGTRVCQPANSGIRFWSDEEGYGEINWTTWSKKTKLNFDPIGEVVHNFGTVVVGEEAREYVMCVQHMGPGVSPGCEYLAREYIRYEVNAVSELDKEQFEITVSRPLWGKDICGFWHWYIEPFETIEISVKFKPSLVTPVGKEVWEISVSILMNEPCKPAEECPWKCLTQVNLRGFAISQPLVDFCQPDIQQCGGLKASPRGQCQVCDVPYFVAMRPVWPGVLSNTHEGFTFNVGSDPEKCEGEVILLEIYGIQQIWSGPMGTTPGEKWVFPEGWAWTSIPKKHNTGKIWDIYFDPDRGSTPPLPGRYTYTVWFECNDPAFSPPLQFQIDVQELKASPALIRFPDGPDTLSTVTFTNESDFTRRILDIRIEEDDEIDAKFSVYNAPESGADIGPAESFDVTVKFKPCCSEGEHTANLVIYYSDRENWEAENPSDGIAGKIVTPIVGHTELTIVTPSGGEEILPAGSTYTIEWDDPNSSSSYDLKYSVNGGTSWKTIKKGIQSKSYDWIVPAFKKNKVDSCLIKVINQETQIDDCSDNPFTIEVVRLLSPTGYEDLTVGDTFETSWLTNATKKPVSKVKLKYSIDGGNSWKNITTLSENPGSYEWTIPDTPSEECLVKVILKSSEGKNLGIDISDRSFSIKKEE